MKILMGMVVLTGVSAYMSFHRSIFESTSILADIVAENYFRGLGRPCVTVAVDPGFMSDFKGANLTVLRLTTSEQDAQCNSTFAARLLSSFYENCFWWVIQVAKPACFYEAWETALFSSYPRQTPGFFFFPTDSPTTDDYEEIFHLNSMNLLVPRLLVAKIEGTQWPVKLFSNDFSQNNPSFNLIDEWGPNEGFKHRVDLFPDKIKNMNGKELVISAVPYPSYIISTVASNNLDGAEVRIVLTFCELYNCSLSYVYDGNQWGDIYPENKTGIGELGLVYEKKSDFGMAANYLWQPFFNYTEYSAPYLEGALIVLVPKESEILGWKKPFKVFKPITWLSFLICLMISSTTLYFATFLTMRLLPDLGKIIRKKAQFTGAVDSVIRSLGMSVLQQPTVLVQGSPVRHIFTSFEFVYFILASMYAAKLASQLTIPQFTAPIDTVSELAENNLIWFGSDPVHVEGIQHSELQKYKTIIKNYRVRTLEEIHEFALTGEYGLIVELMEGGYFTEMPYLDDKTISKVHVMQEKYYSSPLVIVMQKGNPFADKLNDVINKMLNAGLFPYWVGDVTRRYQNYSIQLGLQYARKVHAEDAVKKLNLLHLTGAFILYVVGLFVAVSFLIGEIMTRRFKTRAESRFVHVAD